MSEFTDALRRKLEPIRGFIFVVLALMTSFYGSIYILFYMVPFVFFRPKIWRQFCDYMVGWWLTFPCCLLEFLYGVRFHVSGDLILSDSPGVLIMNHRTRLDWLFLWPALYKMDPWLLTSEKISLKKILKFIPGAGWAMQCASFMFLERKWDKDRHMISDMIDYYKDMGWPYQVLLFPEGTDMTARTKGICRAYARENNLKEYEYVLHPRTTGFTFLTNKMLKAEYMDYLYDITISYKDRLVQGEWEFFTGGCPNDICFHVERYETAVMPKTEEGLAEFCKEIWAEKEEILKDFYHTPPLKRDLTASFEKIRNAKGLKTNLHKWPVEYTGRQKLGIWICWFFWILTILIWTYFFLLLTPLRLYFFLAFVGFLYFLKMHNGLEMLVLDWHKKMELHRKKKNN